MRFTRAGMTALGMAAGMLIAGGMARAQWGLGGMGWGGAGRGNIGDLDPSRLAFRPWVSANGTYTQLVERDPQQTGIQRDFYGYGGAAGISGVKAWERTAVGLFYTASYQRFGGAQRLSGLSQVVGVTAQHRATNRTGLFASQIAGSSLGGFGYGAPAGIFGGWGFAGAGLMPDAGLLGTADDFAANGLVDNEVFSSRVNFSATSAGATFQPTMRWSFRGAMQAASVRRKGRGLSELNTIGATGGASYRVSQRTGIGLVYGYNTFSYPKLFGDNRGQFAGISLRHQITPQTTVGLQFGGYRMDTTFLGVVAVDPEIALLLGVGRQLEVQKRRFYGWQGAAMLNRRWRQWGASVQYMHGVNPGNGVMLASKRDAVFGLAGRSLGRVSFGLFGGYFRWSGLLQRTTMESGSAGVSTGFRVAGDLFMGFNGGYSYFETPTTPRQWRRFASVNLTWSPSAAAFRF